MAILLCGRAVCSVGHDGRRRRRHLRRRHRYRVLEALPWLAAIAAYVAFPSYLALGAQILAMILFALSADLVLGYAGIVTLGHAAFFGTGAYTAGILAAHGWGEPITGLIAGGSAAALIGLLSGLIVLRTTGLTLLMQTLVVATMLAEAANKASFITGGDDGLQGMEVWPIFGRLRFDHVWQYRLFLLPDGAVPVLVGGPAYRPFALWPLADRHSAKMCGGCTRSAHRHPPPARHLPIAAGFAGISGALIGQTTQFVSLSFLSLERSGTVLIMLIMRHRRLYGAFIGVPLYMIAQTASRRSTGLLVFLDRLMMVLLVVFARGGVLGSSSDLR